MLKCIFFLSETSMCEIQNLGQSLFAEQIWVSSALTELFENPAMFQAAF